MGESPNWLQETQTTLINPYHSLFFPSYAYPWKTGLLEFASRKKELGPGTLKLSVSPHPSHACWIWAIIDNDYNDHEL